jgi:DNA-binding response OmpR family regulator
MMTLKTSALKLLIVDDEKAIQRILSHFFKDKHEVVTCNNGAEALSWLYKGNLPDCVIVDMNMPVLDGPAFIHELRSSGFFNDLPVIVLSGSDTSDNKIKCLEAGADDFIAKPFNPRELEARLNSIMRRVTKSQTV